MAYDNVAIIGDGAMATVLAILLCERKISTRVWGYDRTQLQGIEQSRENKKFLPGYKLPDGLVFEPDDRRIMTGADLIVPAVPCQYMRQVWTRLRNNASKNSERRATNDERRATNDERRDLLFSPALPLPMSWPASCLPPPAPPPPTKSSPEESRSRSIAPGSVFTPIPMLSVSS